MHNKAQHPTTFEPIELINTYNTQQQQKRKTYLLVSRETQNHTFRIATKNDNY